MRNFVECVRLCARGRIAIEIGYHPARCATRNIVDALGAT
jgi:hypothetical protein